MDLFRRRNIVIATMHKKETVIAPLLEKTLGAICIVPDHLNTDQFGTFSGEKERKDSPIATARKKCVVAMDETGCDIAIASEGSFGAHPYSFFSRADDELVLLVDRKNNIELLGRELSTETNFDGIHVKSISEALDFAKKVGFPSHGLIIKEKKENAKHIHKGIIDSTVLEDTLQEMLSNYGPVWIETDMRALFNPTRMGIIEKATQNLIEKMASHCPACNYPGYWVIDRVSGLPCALCHQPTQSTLTHLYGCIKCDYTSQKQFPNQKTVEDPTYCDFCNP